MKLGGILFCDRRTGGTDFFTARRTAAAVPFACRFRAVDLPLSAFARAGVGDAALIVNYGFHSLLEHIGSGKPWDFARTSGGLRTVSPYRYARGGVFRTRLEALLYMTETLEALECDLLVLSDCDILLNPDLGALAAAHRESGARLTLLAAHGATATDGELLLKADAAHRVTDAAFSRSGRIGWRFLGTWLVERRLLLAALAECRARSGSELLQDLLLPLARRVRTALLPYSEPYLDVGSAQAYYESALALLADRDLRNALIANPARPIYTSDRPTPPTVYGREGEALGSLIAEGCRIEGRVENCLLFRGVTVGRGSCVRNSVLFGGSYIGRGCVLSAVVTEKHTLIRDGVHLAGHPTLPLFIDQGKVC